MESKNIKNIEAKAVNDQIEIQNPLFKVNNVLKILNVSRHLRIC